LARVRAPANQSRQNKGSRTVGTSVFYKLLPRTDKLGVMSMLLFLLLLLPLRANSADVARTVLTVTIRPALALTVVGDETLVLKIRLGTSSRAFLWRDSVCETAPVNGYLISESGTYSVSIAAIEGDGTKVCVGTSDGTLRASVPVSVGR
jgi:hypothetical protein